ncbi:MAG: enoyl-CoA hydratase-related protein [Bacteroidota bacterium]|nr:enoyl-CoA hydratase-related protein [Rhodothermia bacterium]MCS7154861.1 enoyl-CoA hydratase-related protein [Bacteroidota bacterium]MDW8137655.1 enoyl-CoA hydratase-related protein [Bacteroidota bacterium]MDW8285391.1 enoyl-CoA hydratase-related protein [Bacteroidota bacterium]
MPAYATLHYEQPEAGIGWLELNRPEQLNAFDEVLTRELQEVLRSLERAPDLRALVLTGAGRGFCAGQDLKSLDMERERSLGESLERRYNPIIRRLRALPVPVIAAVNGAAAGAGMSLALACDVRIAAESAFFVQAFVRIGLVPDSGSSFFLVHLLGYARAFEIATLGERISAAEALRLGLVNRVVPDEALRQEALDWARRYASLPPKALALTKRLLAKATHASLDEMLDYERYCQEIAGRTEDYREGVAAFQQKRPPVFKGR